MITNGARLQSQVCDTQIIVVRSAASLCNLHCGGTAMIAIGATKDTDVVLDSAYAAGNQIGKRYVDDAGAEVLVTKAGSGTLAIGTAAMAIKQARPLPASD